MNNSFPTSVNTEITEHATDEGYSVLTINGRPMGCKIDADLRLEDASITVIGWYLSYMNKQWVVADYINQCAVKFGETASQIIPFDSLMMPKASSTLSNWCSIVAQYEAHERVYPLSFSHYAAVAYVQDRAMRESLLVWALENQASVDKLTAEKQRRIEMLTEAAQDAPILNEPIQPEETYQEFSSDEISGIFAGNIKPLIRLFAIWRGKVQSGKRYKLMLVEVE